MHPNKKQCNVYFVLKTSEDKWYFLRETPCQQINPQTHTTKSMCSHSETLVQQTKPCASQQNKNPCNVYFVLKRLQPRDTFYAKHSYKQIGPCLYAYNETRVQTTLNRYARTTYTYTTLVEKGQTSHITGEFAFHRTPAVILTSIIISLFQLHYFFSF